MEIENLQIKISASAEGVEEVLGQVKSAVSGVAQAYEEASGGAARLINGGGDIPRVLVDTVLAATQAGAAAARAFNEAFASGKGGGDGADASAGGSGDGKAGGAAALAEGFEELQNVELSPLLEDLSNLAAVEDQAYQKLVAVRTQMESVGHTPQLDRWNHQLLDACVSLQELRKGSTALRDLEQKVQSLASQSQASRTLLDLSKSAKQNQTSFDGLDGSLKTYIRDHNLVGQSMGAVVASIEREGSALDGQRASMNQTLTSMRSQYIQTKQAIETGATGRFSADGSDLFAEADAAIQWLNELLALLGAAGGAGGATGAKRGGGGGGGRKRDDDEAEQRRADEAAARAREEAQQSALDAQLRLVEHEKRLGEISTREEIAQLEYIARKYAVTGQQKLDMEERIFEARARLRDEEIAEIDRLNQGIQDALRNRYEQQAQLEQQRLDSSIDAWRDWADQNVAAIQTQIDALDQLEASESRADQDAEKRRKIDAVRQMIGYTHDEANLDQLQRELERLEEEYAKWQHGNALSDEKDRLRAQQEEVRARATLEQDALDAQKQASSAQYDALLKESSLRAEAERTLARANQKEILQLIRDYAPDYEATGKSLGERMFAGMSSAMGGISQWVERFQTQIAAAQQGLASQALAAADRFHASEAATSSTQVHQTNNFNVPVESPADTARKVLLVSEELARQIAGA